MKLNDFVILLHFVHIVIPTRCTVINDDQSILIGIACNKCGRNELY